MKNHSIITIILGLILVVSCTEKPLTMNFASNTNLLNLAGAPEPLTKVGSYSIQVSGDEISEYRFKSGPKATTDCTVESGYSEPKFVSESLTGTAPVDGDYKLCVIGKSSKSGQWHELTNASVVNWVLDMTAPSLSGVISDGTFVASTTESSSLSWTAGSDSGSGMDKYQLAIGTTSGGTEVLSWTDIGQVTTYQKTGLSLTSGTTYYPSIRLLDKAGNISGVITGDGWTPDTTPPNVGSLSFNDGNGSWPTTESPTITWVGANDTGSGLSHYEIAIGTVAGGTDLQNWTSVGNVTTYKKTGLTLTRGQNYYASIRAVDNLGNINLVQGDGWHVRNEMWTTNGSVNTMLEFNNKLYIGGKFSSVGQWTGGFSVLSPGSMQQVNWPQIPKVSGEVYAIVVIGSEIFIGGKFNAVDGLPRQNIAKIQGYAVDPTWNPGVNGTVLSLESFAGRLIVGGDFSLVGGQARSNLAAIDFYSGNVDPWDPNPNSTVYTTKSMGGTGLYVGGDFTSFNGGADIRNKLAFFESGLNLNAWNPNIDDTVLSLAIDGYNNILYVGGWFNNVNSTPRNLIAAFNATTRALMTWDANITSGNYVTTITLEDNFFSDIYFGGSFDEVNGTTRNQAAAVSQSGVLTAFNPDLDNEPSSMLASGGNIYTAGWFTTTNGGLQNKKYVSVFLNFNGMDVSSGVEFNNTVHTIVKSSGLLYLGGKFTTVNSPVDNNIRSRLNLASFDLTTGELTNWNPQLKGEVRVLHQKNSTLYVGGQFTELDSGYARNNLGSFDLSTGGVNSWNPNLNGPVFSLASTATDLYVGGFYTQASGSSRSALSSFNLTTGALNNWDPQANSNIMAMVIDGTKLYVGGSFSTFNSGGVTRNKLASFNLSTGFLDTWNPNVNNIVNDLAVSGGNLYVGGTFTAVSGGIPRNRLASYDMTSGSLNTWNPDINGAVTRLFVSGATLYIGGNFTAASGGSDLRTNIASYNTATGNISTFAPMSGLVTSMLITGENMFLGSDLGGGGGSTMLSPIDLSTGLWLPGD